MLPSLRQVRSGDFSIRQVLVNGVKKQLRYRALVPHLHASIGKQSPFCSVLFTEACATPANTFTSTHSHLTNLSVGQSYYPHSKNDV